MNNYLTILEEGLHKKIKVLEHIQEYNEKQKDAFLSGAVSMQDFDVAVEEKGRLIEEVQKLDQGFETLYANVSAQLKANKDAYKEQIGRMQQLITRITELSTTIQVREARNKQLVEEFFSKQRGDIRQSRISSKAAYDYYKNMSGTKHVPPQFMDSKQ